MWFYLYIIISNIPVSLMNTYSRYNGYRNERLEIYQGHVLAYVL